MKATVLNNAVIYEYVGFSDWPITYRFLRIDPDGCYIFAGSDGELHPFFPGELRDLRKTDKVAPQSMQSNVIPFPARERKVTP